MSGLMWVALMITWFLVGLAAAYLFGRFTHRGEAYGDAGRLAPPVVSYLRRAKRAKASSRPATHAKSPREASGGRSVH